MLMRFYCIDQNSQTEELPFHLLKKSLPSYKVYPLKYGDASTEDTLACKLA